MTVTRLQILSLYSFIISVFLCPDNSVAQARIAKMNATVSSVDTDQTSVTQVEHQKTEATYKSNSIFVGVDLLYSLQRITDEKIFERESKGAIRGELELFVSEKFTLGFGIGYRAIQDKSFILPLFDPKHAGFTDGTKKKFYEVGLFSTIPIRSGFFSNLDSFCLRPRLELLAVTGTTYTFTYNPDGVTREPHDLSTKTGYRTGADLVYRIIAKNGGTFQAGTGFTYYLSKWSVDFHGSHEEPSRWLLHAFGVVGWAF